MGSCHGSKSSAAAEPAPPSSPKGPLEGSCSAVSEVPGEPGTTVDAASVGAPKMTSDSVRSILQAVKASSDQMQFFEAWNEIVLKGLGSSTTNSGNVVVAADLSSVEFRLVGAADAMVDRAKCFVNRCGVPPAHTNELENLKQEMDCNVCTLFWKFKNLGGARGKEPAIDAGFIVAGQLDWVVADMLMPPVVDQDALREYAVQELHTPGSYGSSIFPVEPEKQLTFEMGTGAPRKALLSAFFFFKALGFAKPEDSVVRVLNSCQCAKYTIGVYMGPKGLTRLSISLYEPSKEIHKDLSECLRHEYNHDGLTKISQILNGADLEFTDYVADSNGYSVGVGFILSGYDPS